MLNPLSLIAKLRQKLRSRTDVILRGVLKNAGWATIGQAVTVVVAFIETILLARFLSVKMFGVFIVIASIAGLVFGLLHLRTGEAVIKFLPHLKQSLGNRAVSSFLRLVIIIDGAVSVVGFLIVIFVGFFLANWLGFPHEYAFVFVILGGGLALKTTVGSVGSYLRVTDAFPLSVKLGIIAAVFRLIAICTAVIIAPGITVISCAIALSNCMFFLLMVFGTVISFRSLEFNPLGAPIKLISGELKSIRSFLLGTSIARILKELSTKLDVLFIAALSSIEVVALYKVSARIAGALLLFSDPLVVSVYPEMSKLHAVNADAQLRKMLFNLTKIFTILAASLFLFFILFGKWILITLVGVQYVDAYPVLTIMIIGTSLAMMFFWARPMLLVYEMINKIVVTRVACLIVQFTCLYLLIPVLGVQAAGLAFTLNYVVAVSLFLYWLFKAGILIPSMKEKIVLHQEYS